jgi:hypothetical protein
MTDKQKKQKSESKQEVKVAKPAVPERPKRVTKRKLPQKKQAVTTFNAWWTLAQRKFGLQPHMKEALYKHFKARGFISSKNYDEGLRDFGFKA